MLSKEYILKLIQDQKLLIEPYSEEASVKDASVMLHLGSSVQKLTSELVDTNKLSEVEYQEEEISKEGYILEPNEFVLIKTHEKITMPQGYIGWIETRGTLANIGLQVHFCDAHIDPGSSLNINLQLKNNSKSKIKIHKNMYLAKMYVEEMVR